MAGEVAVLFYDARPGRGGGALTVPHVRVLGELDGFWRTYREVAKDLSPRGNLVPDAHLAALLRQHGVTRVGDQCDHVGNNGDHVFWGADEHAAAVAVLVEVARGFVRSREGEGVILAASDGKSRRTS